MQIDNVSRNLMLTIEQISQLTGVRKSTLRYWEKSFDDFLNDRGEVCHARECRCSNLCDVLADVQSRKRHQATESPDDLPVLQFERFVEFLRLNLRRFQHRALTALDVHMGGAELPAVAGDDAVASGNECCDDGHGVLLSIASGGVSGKVNGGGGPGWV